MSHTVHCATAAVAPAAMWGSGFTMLSVAQGAYFTPQLLASNVGFLFAYHAIQCPLEELHGRRSLLHNGIAGGVLGYAGIQSGHLGVPFGHMLPPAMYRMRPAVVGAIVYGGLASALGALSKPL